MSTVGRPKMKEAKKRVAIGVSLAPTAHEILEKAENKSKFIENSVLSMNALASIMLALRAKRLSLAEAVEEILSF